MDGLIALYVEKCAEAFTQAINYRYNIAESNPEDLITMNNPYHPSRRRVIQPDYGIVYLAYRNNLTQHMINLRNWGIPINDLDNLQEKWLNLMVKVDNNAEAHRGIIVRKILVFSLFSDKGYSFWEKKEESIADYIAIARRDNMAFFDTEQGIQLRFVREFDT